MAYGEHTKVPFPKTVSDILVMLRKAGAEQVGQFEESQRLTIMFRMNERQVRFRITWANNSDREQRQRGRALFLVIKAKLESVESQVETFEEAFLPNVVMANGQTVYERVAEPIALEYKAGTVQPMLMISSPAGR